MSCSRENILQAADGEGVGVGHALNPFQDILAELFDESFPRIPAVGRIISLRFELHRSAVEVVAHDDLEVDVLVGALYDYHLDELHRPPEGVTKLEIRIKNELHVELRKLDVG